MSSPSPTICILGAAFKTQNLGVSVLAAGAIQTVLRPLPHAHIVQLDYGREQYQFEHVYGDLRTALEFVSMRFSKNVFLWNNITTLLALAIIARIMPDGPLRRAVYARSTVLCKLADATLVLAIAGGDSFSDIYGIRRFFYTTLPQLLVLIMGKKLVLLPQTIGPFRSTFTRRFARRILHGATMILTRDFYSQRYTRSLLHRPTDDQKVGFCFDLGFDIGPQPVPLPGLESSPAAFAAAPLVGINLSGLLMMGGYRGDNTFGLKSDYATLMRRIIDQFLATSARIVLVPHVLGTGGESDLSVCQEQYRLLGQEYPGRVLFFGGMDYAATKYLISRCDFFVGARMHACIGALSQGVPAVAIAYSDKFSGVLETVGCGHLVVDPRTMSDEQMLDIIRGAFENRDGIRAFLLRTMPDVTQNMRRMLRPVFEGEESGRRSPLAVLAAGQ